MVGPEGDFTTSEVQMMVAAGVHPVGLGDLRLRTETAGLALLTAAMLFESSARI
jgi:16S rRNA (uracil1498-N3)-methyltransferase